MASGPLFDHLNKSLQSLFIQLLNQDPLAIMKAAHQLGGVQMNSRQLEIFRGKQSLERGDQVEVAKNQQTWRGKAEDLQSKKDAVQSFIDFAENCRSQPIRFLRANISRRLVKCAKCGRYSVAENDRPGRLYCSRKTGRNCASNATATARVHEKRTADKEKNLQRARLAIRSWNGAGDWKPWVAKRSSVTVNWITYRISDGDLKAPA